MAYNAFVATNTRLRKKEATDSPATAGAAKVATVTARSKSELKELGERMGWTPRKLTAAEIRGEMSGQEMLWHEAWNSDNYRAAFTIEENQKNNKQNMVGWNAKRMWEGRATEEESQKAFAAGDRFASNFSQFVRSVANGEVMTSYMAEHNLDATQVQSYVEAFEVLAPQGKLVLSPKAAGIGLEDRLEGEAVRLYPRLYLLLQPNKVLKPEDKLSADEWFSQHPELHETRTPPIIIQKQQVAAATAAHFEQTKTGTAEGQAVRFTDMGGKDYSGYPSHPTKFSFRRLLDSLSAVDFNKRLNEDAQFSAAVDRLNNGNQ